MVIDKAKTRGGKYHIELHQVSSQSFNICHFTNDQETGCNCNIPSLAEAEKKFQTIINDSAKYDGINYKRFE